MKGIVFQLLESSIQKRHGEDFWDDLLDSAGVDGAYTSLGTYDDEELFAIVSAAAERLASTPEDIVRWFASEAAATFAERFPAFFAGHKTTRTFLMTLNDIIHPEVRKLYPQALTPHFNYETDALGRLVMHYRSHRNFCAFGEGLIIGCSRQYGEQAIIEQPLCKLRGDDHCVFVVDFTAAAN
jgi:hypothetical protein